MNEYTKQFIRENIAEILFSIPKTIFLILKYCRLKVQLKCRLLSLIM